MKKLTALLFCTLAYGFSHGQQAILSGTILDTFSNKKLSNTVVSVLQAKDSILYRFTRSDAAGRFQLNHLAAGSYLLLVSYPGYADYVEPVHLTDTSALYYNHIILSLKARLLEAVVVRQTMASIKFKGDTTEYAADSFKVQANASVEELLKKLPGMQVDKNGHITVQGEKIQKVLVDGEEFFGDDPTLVTQNLRADMVDKVQVFDKKSDQASFTGIDDGQSSKTLNLKLKDNKKNGYFGKLTTGAGSNGYHESQAMVNLFRKKQKLSAYGIVSNTGKTGLNWQENDQYGQSIASSFSYDEANDSYSMEGGTDDLNNWDGRYNNQGYPLVQTGGIHYNNKWDNDRQSINANYKILQLYVNGNSNTRSQYILPDTLYYNNEQQRFNNKILRSRANGSYELQADSSTSLKITADGGTDHKSTNSLYQTEARGSDSVLVNQGLRNMTTTGDEQTINSNLLWRKKLRKKGRTLSFNLMEQYGNNHTEGYLNSTIHFYQRGLPGSTQQIDQFKNNQSRNILFDTKLTYTEPLSKISSLVFNYGVVLNNSSSNRSSYNKAPEGKYNLLDTLYSNDYNFNQLTHRGGISYSLIKKKLRINLGNNMGFTNFNQKDLRRGIVQQRNFVNLYPQASFSYLFSGQRRLNLNYNGNTRQPSINQVQPVLTNEDPLNIILGNAALKPQFENNIQMNFNDYKVLSDRSIWMSTSYHFTRNAISTRNTVDANGKRTNQAVNVNGNRSFNSYLDYNYKLKKLDLRIGTNGNISINRYVNYVNNALNVTNSSDYQLELYLNKYQEKKYEFNLSSSATYTTSNSSVQENLKISYWAFKLHSVVTVFLPLHFQVFTDADLNLRQKINPYDQSVNVLLWNAWIGKKFLKGETLLVKASVNDLLNQNTGFNRQVNSNFITQNTYSTIRRYLLLSVEWSFTKAGTPASTLR